MAFDKPWRHIPARGRAVARDGHEGCMHSLMDKQKVTRIPKYYAYHVWYCAEELADKFLHNMSKLKKLTKRRKAKRQMEECRNNQKGKGT